MSTPTHDPALNELANVLARLRPAPAPLDRDLLMYRAGLLARRRWQWFWPCLAAAMTLLATGLGLGLLFQPPHQQVHQVIVVRETQPPPETAPPVPAAAADHPARQPPLTYYTQLQEQVLRWGLDGLPQPPAPPADKGPTLDQFPGSPAGPWDQRGRTGL
jgi:hypothetical protein